MNIISVNDQWQKSYNHLINSVACSCGAKIGERCYDTRTPGGWLIGYTHVARERAMSRLRQSYKWETTNGYQEHRSKSS